MLGGRALKLTYWIRNFWERASQTELRDLLQKVCLLLSDQDSPTDHQALMLLMYSNLAPARQKSPRQSSNTHRGLPSTHYRIRGKCRRLSATPDNNLPVLGD